MKFCPFCGHKIVSDASFCVGCGKELPDVSNGETPNALVETTETHQPHKKRPHRWGLVCILGAVLLVCGIVAVLLPSIIGSKQPPKSGDSNTSNFVDDPDAIALASQSMVKLNCYDDQGKLVTTGSGFTAFEDGVIVTNYHVIKDEPARIEFITETGKKCDIFGVVGVEIERDIAILYYKSTNLKLPILSTGNANILKKGEKVVAIGSPLGLANVVSAGVFSGYANIGNATDIQFTASISSGSSGGALFNNNGEVIGITYASLEAGQNLNLAVPIEFVESLWRTERENRQELSLFYDSLIPTYTVEYVIKHYKELYNCEFYIEGWVSSFTKLNDQKIVIYVVGNYDDIYDRSVNNMEERIAADQNRSIENLVLKVENTNFYHPNISIGKELSIRCTGVGVSSNKKEIYAIATLYI